MIRRTRQAFMHCRRMARGPAMPSCNALGWSESSPDLRGTLRDGQGTRHSFVQRLWDGQSTRHFFGHFIWTVRGTRQAFMHRLRTVKGPAMPSCNALKVGWIHRRSNRARTFNCCYITPFTTWQDHRGIEPRRSLAYPIRTPERSHNVTSSGF